MDFSRQEQKGAEYSQAAAKLMVELVSGNNLDKVQAAYKILADLDEKYGGEFETKLRISALRSALELNRGYESAQAVQKLIIQVGDGSNLILDPNLDSYYTMDAVINKLPMILEKREGLRVQMRRVLENRQMSVDDRLELLMLVGNLRTNSDGLGAGLNVAFRGNGATRAALEKKLTIQQQRETEMIEVVNRFLVSGSVDAMTTADGAMVMQKIEMARQADAELILAGNLELIRLLDVRINAMTVHKRNILILTGIFLILVNGMIILIYRSVNSGLERLTYATDRMQAGDLTIKTAIAGKDEIALVGQAFDNMVQSLHEMVLQTQDVGERLTKTASVVGENAGDNQQAATDISAFTQNLTSVVQEQLRTMSDIGGNLQEISNDIEEIAGFSAATGDRATIVREQARRGQGMLENIVKNIDSVYQKSLHTEQEMNAMVETLQTIDQAIQTIDAIANQPIFWR